MSPDPDLPAPRTPDGGSFTAMTLRDFFAAHALVLIAKEGYASDEDGDFVAKFAYEIADWMLAEREKRAEPTP